jgi:GcrA cell cycle regulator
MPKLKWTPEEDAVLRRLWPTRSARQLGVLLKKTRNAVIGRVQRLKLSTTPEQKRQRQSEGMKRMHARRRPKRKPLVPPAAKAVPPEAPETTPTVADQPKLIELMELTRTTCRWPFGERAPFKFCGCEAIPGWPYCGPHARASMR